MDQYRQAIWDEIHDYRREVRSIGAAAAARQRRVEDPTSFSARPSESPPPVPETPPPQYDEPEPISAIPLRTASTTFSERDFAPALSSTDSVVDPIATYARRSSLMAPPAQQFAFPTAGAEAEVFVVPNRSRVGSTGAVEPMLRTLSTVSVRERGTAAALANIRFGLSEQDAADAPPSEIPLEFRTRADRAREEAAAAAFQSSLAAAAEGEAPSEVSGSAVEAKVEEVTDAPAVPLQADNSPYSGCAIC